MTEVNYYNHDRMLQNLKMAYRKCCLDDLSIGWEKMENNLRDVLCEVMGDDAFINWLDDYEEDLDWSDKL